MTKLRINLPEELNKEFRTIIASKYGYSKGALSKATQDAILKWIIKNGKEPWLYIDNNMTFDIDQDIFTSFLEIISRIINPEKIILSFKASDEEIKLISKIFENIEIEDNEVSFSLRKSELIQIYKQLATFIKVNIKASLMIEFDDIYIIGGGSGCFNICGAISTHIFNQIVAEFLKFLKIDLEVKLDTLKNYQIFLLNPNSKIIVLSKT